MARDEHWAVTVSRDGEEIVTIEHGCLSGRDISPEDDACIRRCAEHLLAFIGVPLHWNAEQVRADAAEQQAATLRAALVGLVGMDGRADLEQLEAVMRMTPAPAADKAVTIDAIHALLATLAEPPSGTREKAEEE